MSVRTVSVSSACELSDAQKAKIEKFFSAKHVGEVLAFDYKIDKELIGGFLAVDGDKFYDGSVRAQIDRLGAEFKVSEKYAEASASPKRRRSKKNALSADGDEAPTAENASMPTSADEIKKRTDAELSRTVRRFKKSYDVGHAGSVEFCGDGVIMCTGLSDAEYGEMLQVENGARAIVLSLSENSVGAIVLDDDDKVSAHMVVKTTGMIVSVPVGEQLLGRVVDPLGKPIDGLGDFTPDRYRPIEAPAPAIKDRDKVNSPLFTGLLAVDSMIPIGKGQRELIIGDRETGKSSIAIDTILNQKGKNVICVYVAIGQKSSSVASVYDTLTKNGAMDYTLS